MRERERWERKEREVKCEREIEEKPQLLFNYGNYIIFRFFTIRVLNST